VRESGIAVDYSKALPEWSKVDEAMRKQEQWSIHSLNRVRKALRADNLHEICVQLSYFHQEGKRHLE
jgi:hypothetical protein